MHKYSILFILLVPVLSQASVVVPVSLDDGREGDLICESLSSLQSCAESASVGVENESGQARTLVQSALRSLRIEQKDGLEAALDFSRIAACAADGTVTMSDPGLGNDIMQWLSRRISIASVLEAQDQSSLDDLLSSAIAAAPENSAVIVSGGSRCQYRSNYLDQWRGVLDIYRGVLADGGIDILIKRPARSQAIFETSDANRLLSHLVTTTASERNAGAGACTVKEAEMLGTRFADRPNLGNQENWDLTSLLGCPARNWLRHWLRHQRNAPIIRLALAGANKGYGLAAILRDLSPGLNITPASWGRSLRAKGARLAMGWCRDGLDDEISADNDRNGLKTRVEALLIEPLLSNVQLVEYALQDAGFRFDQGIWQRDSITVRLEVACAGNATGRTQFPRLAPGEEVGAALPIGTRDNDQMFFGHFADESKPTYDQVPVLTLDSIFEQEPLDALFIDAEGSDPAIIQGAYANVLPRLRLLEFEYHATGHWQDTSLASLVTQLDLDFGFDCFLQGPRGDDLWRLSRACWSPAFEIRRWSNVVCARRSDALTSSLLTRNSVVL